METFLYNTPPPPFAMAAMCLEFEHKQAQTKVVIDNVYWREIERRHERRFQNTHIVSHSKLSHFLVPLRIYFKDFKILGYFTCAFHAVYCLCLLSYEIVTTNLLA